MRSSIWNSSSPPVASSDSKQLLDAARRRALATAGCLPARPPDGWSLRR